MITHLLQKNCTWLLNVRGLIQYVRARLLLEAQDLILYGHQTNHIEVPPMLLSIISFHSAKAFNCREDNGEVRFFSTVQDS